MQKLPGAKQNLMKYEEHEFSFYGLKHSEGARDGDIYDLLNISLDNFPSMSVRKERRKLSYETGEKVYGIGSADKLFWCSGAPLSQAEPASHQQIPEQEFAKPKGEPLAWFYYDGEEKFSVEVSEKTFAVINKYICIFPDKMYYSLWGDEAVNLHGDITLYSSLELLNEAMGTSESIKDGDVYAVGTAEPYSFFQYNSQGEWIDKKDMDEYAYGLQTRWIYLMDSWGSLESVQSSFTTRTDGMLDMYQSADGIGYDTFESYNAEKILDLNSLRIGDNVEIRVTFYDKDTKEFIYKKYIAKLSGITVKKSGFDTDGYYYRYCFSGLAVPEKVNGDGKESSSGDYVRYTAEVKRAVPDLEYSFCHDNRLWGCEKDKIYASKLGDPFNFMDYSTLADASWTVGIASSEPFTGAVAYNGSPTFFKEDRIIKVSGNYPAQYSTYETADIPGVAKGSGKSLAICNGYLYYLSPEGVCSYSGSYPSIIGDDIGEVLSNGYGGAGGDKYYLEASVAYGNKADAEQGFASGENTNSVLASETEEQGTNGALSVNGIPPVASDIPPLGKGGKAVYVYDTRTRAWTKENALDAVGFTDIGRDLYALTKSGIYLLDSVKDEGTAETNFESFIEFAPIYDSHLTKKGVSRIHVSLKVNTGASVRFLLSYDGEGYKEVFSIAPSMRRNYNIPLTVRRCGYYSLKITGSGSYTVYGIGRERYFGSDM